MSKTSLSRNRKAFGQAEQIVEALQNADFPASEISVLLPDDQGRHDIGHVKATKAPEVATTEPPAESRAARSAGPHIGATTGGVGGGLIGMRIPEIEAKRFSC